MLCTLTVKSAAENTYVKINYKLYKQYFSQILLWLNRCTQNLRQKLWTIIVFRKDDQRIEKLTLPSWTPFIYNNQNGKAQVPKTLTNCVARKNGPSALTAPTTQAEEFLHNCSLIGSLWPWPGSRTRSEVLRYFLTLHPAISWARSYYNNFKGQGAAIFNKLFIYWEWSAQFYPQGCVASTRRLWNRPLQTSTLRSRNDIIILQLIKTLFIEFLLV